MATILLVGSEEALLEGLVQSLTALGHRPLLVHDVAEAMDAVADTAPLLAIISREVMRTDPRAQRIPLCPGGALVLFRTSRDPVTHVGLSARNILAELVLPLERNRLLALVQHVEERVRVTGREQSPDTRSDRRI